MRKFLFVILLLVFALPLAVSAQEANSFTTADQVVLDGSVEFPSVTVDRAGWMVIHIDNGGSPGPVIGATLLEAGTTENVSVEIDVTQATPVLFGMLHDDTGAAGVYEFGTVEGADGPMRDSAGNVLVAPFNVQIIWAIPNKVVDNRVVVNSVTTDAPGWMVIHSDNGGRPGPVLGQTQVQAGTTLNVAVELAAEGRTDVVFPMLHVDTGEAGVYEFGSVEGADGPVAINGVVAVTGIHTTPFLSVPSQSVLSGENAMGTVEAGTPHLLISGVLSDGPGFVVIHADNNGAPGAVLTNVAVPDGYSSNFTVEFPADAQITPVVFPMLHVDTGTVGAYEFGAVEGADGPVRDSAGNVITFPINIAPSISVAAQPVVDGTVTIPGVVIDQPGWLVIHSDNGGSPGPVLGQTWIGAGYTSNVVVALTGDAGTQVFPMLHYDTGEIGVYEFGSVEGADGPVRFGGAVVVLPMEITQ